MPFTATAMRAFAAILAFAAVTTALPAGVTVEMIESHLQSHDLQSPVPGLPRCSQGHKGKPNGENEDPTYAIGTSNYTDGQGGFIGDDCHHKNHCWTDYFLVGYQNSYDNWYKVVGDLQCPATGTCSQAISSQLQTCKTDTWIVSENIGATAKTELLDLSVDVTVTEGQVYQACNANTTTDTCNWTDAACHSI
jgi:hypothetical protein